MSQLEVDKIIPQSGTTLTIGDSGDTITFGTGTTPQLGGDLSTNGNDINFGDNDKAQFGASNDLQIYHDGSNSYISDVGTGNLRIQATNFEVANGAYTKSYIVASDGAEVTLKYNNNNKLSTTSTGVDVTGKTTTDSIDAVGGQSGSTPIVKIENSVGDNLVSFKRTTGTPSDEFAIGADSASLHFKNSTLSTYIMSLSEGGDISFYEDTGTTPKLFWDASAESLGVGTSSPSSFNQYADNLVVGTTSGDNGITIASGTANSGRFVFSDNTTSSASAFVGAIEYSHTSDAMIFYTSASEAMRIDSSGNVGIGITSPFGPLHLNGGVGGPSTTGNMADVGLIVSNTAGGRAIQIGTDSTDSFNFIQSAYVNGANVGNDLAFFIGATERMRIDSSGNLLVGKTSTADAVGVEVRPIGYISVKRASTNLNLNRATTDGNIVNFQKDSSDVGIIGTEGNDLIIGTGDTGVQYCDSLDSIRPWHTGTNAGRDNAIDLGTGNVRFDDIFATNGTIQTSDQNEKQSIQTLTSSEIAVAKRISKLFKTFKWNSAVEEKGDSARTHTGVIAQDVQQAFADEGLDASNYALFISSTWWEKEISVDAVAEELDEEGNVIVEGQDAYTYIDTKEEATEGYTERTRLGIRYPELLSFVSSAFEQRLTDIETRLTALET